MIDPIYIDNAAMAHFLAADRLEPGSPDRRQDLLRHPGRDDPALGHDRSPPRAAGLAPVRRSITRPLAFATAGLLELGYFLSRRSAEPPLTRFLARQLSTTHWFNIDAARRDLGYEPRSRSPKACGGWKSICVQRDSGPRPQRVRSACNVLWRAE